jgi:uncharacterized membrane protein (TIGR02234 family)
VSAAGPAAPARPARRELAAAVAGAAVAGGLALSAGGQAWLTATLRRPAPIPPVTEPLTGGTLAPLVPACGLLLLAAAVALVAVRGAGRVVVGLLVAVAGGVLGWSGLRLLVTGGEAAAVAVVGGGTPGSTLSVATAPVWPVLAVVAGLVAVATGLLAVARGRRWPAMGRRYERPAGAVPTAPAATTTATSTATPAAARPVTDEDRALDAWRALDRGEDPTDPAPGATGRR